MSFLSWLRNQTSPHAPNGRVHSRPASRCQLHLEALEDRTVPSTFSAATSSDLIGDIQAANQQGGANTIVLTAPASSPYALAGAQIAAGDTLTIVPGDGTGRTLDAGKTGRLFDIAAGGSLTLQNLTLQNGFVFTFGLRTAPQNVGEHGGGAIYNHGTLVLSQVTVQDCAATGYSGFGQAAAGGGIWSDGALTVANSTFRNNSATGSNDPGSEARGGNAYGGAICIAGGSASITGSFFGQGNLAAGGFGASAGGGSAYGGAVYVAAGTVTLNADTVGNSPGGSGAKSNMAQGGSVTNLGYGGGICVAGGSVTLTNDTIEYNTAAATGVNGAFEPAPTLAGHGGGVFVAPGASVAIDAFTLANTILNKSAGSINIYGTYILLK